VKTSAILRLYRLTSIALLVVLALMPLIFRHNIIFATFATTVTALVLMLIAFRVQKLQLLLRATSWRRTMPKQRAV
jgi:hypothetical protein